MLHVMRHMSPGGREVEREDADEGQAVGVGESEGVAVQHAVAHVVLSHSGLVHRKLALGPRLFLHVLNLRIADLHQPQRDLARV